MSRTSTSALRDGVILNNRYRIMKQIGRGGFGRAYLAEDNQRYRELCVLKEFAPQVDGDDELRQAEDLFEREAGILYKLNHRQIPRFEALLRTRINGWRSLFLVQEYVPGKSYWELMQRYGRLTEAEVTEMIREILPVLDYIHSCDLIHRDISPDNLILRDLDERPVLIDFGCVKLAANAVSKSKGYSVTLIGKKGYSPDEQIRRGQAMPSSDLYALAATSVVLLTGKQPDRLYNYQTGQWDWEQIEASSHLKQVLRKMLAERPCDRYPSVERVRQALETRNSVFTSFISRFRTRKVAPGESRPQSSWLGTRIYRSRHSLNSRNFSLGRISDRIPRLFNTSKLRRLKPWHWGLVASTVVVIPGLVSFASMNYRITKTIAFNLERDSKLVLNEEESDLQRRIKQRVESLNLDASSFYKQVDNAFHQKYPELAGEQLSDKGEHQQYRQVWYRIASSLLQEKERQR